MTDKRDDTRDAQIESELASVPLRTGQELDPDVARRMLALLTPKGHPKEVDIWENIHAATHIWTVLFTGDVAQRRSMCVAPLNNPPAVFGELAEGQEPDADWGQQVGFKALDALARQAVLEEYCRIHKLPTIKVFGPRELTEREVGHGLELWRRTGRAPIPVPPLPDKPPQSVEILARGDDGVMRPTLNYYMLNPLPGELMQGPAEERETKVLALGIIACLRNGDNIGETFGYCMALIADMNSAPEFDWPELKVRVKGHFLQHAADSHPEAYEALAEKVDAVVGLLEDEGKSTPQHGWPIAYQQVHVTTRKTVEAAQEAGSIWTVCGHDATIEGLRFMGADRLENVGLPPFHQLCGECSDGLAFLKSKQLPAQTMNLADINKRLEGEGLPTIKLDPEGSVGLYIGPDKEVELGSSSRPGEGQGQAIVRSFATDESELLPLSARERWASDRLGYPSNGISIAYYHHAGYTLALLDTGRTDSMGKAQVAYLFFRAGETLTEVVGANVVEPDIITEGDDFYPSPMRSDPVGHRAAADWLTLFMGQELVEEVDGKVGVIAGRVGKFLMSDEKTACESWPLALEEFADDEEGGPDEGGCCGQGPYHD
ncbi:MAG TPA: hypothetical protein VEY08_11880 [Chloroflexia bacterium]|nr:hypothetical protein [Chloroflexia bacterium]